MARTIGRMSTIRKLAAEHAEAYVALRRAMLAEAPTAFLASEASDIGCDLEQMRGKLGGDDDNVVYGAFAGGTLVGVVGILRFLRHAKAAHRADIWGMYVDPAARGQGLGRGLVEAAVAHARTNMAGVLQVHLGVVETQAPARALYEACGFQAWGVEPGAVRVDGRLYDETHMVLPLAVR